MDWADGLYCVCYITNPTNTHSGQSAAHIHQISALCPCRCKISRIARCLGHVVLPDRGVGTGLEGFGCRVLVGDEVTPCERRKST